MGGRRRLDRPGVGSPGESEQEGAPGKSGVSIPRRETIVSFGKREVVNAMLPGKVSKHKSVGTVPQTDTGGHVE